MNEDGVLHIRLATATDAAAISALVVASARRYVFPDQSEAAVGQLLDWMGAPAIAGRIEAGHRHHVAEFGQTIIGVVGTRDDCHLHLLFVDERCHRCGIAWQLWTAALAACLASARPPTRITVNASAYAVPVYRQFGFVEAGAPACKDDIVAIPMVFTVSDDPSAR